MPIKKENRKLYGPNWKQISHNIRFGRARGRCEHCGVLHGQRRLFGRKHSVVILTTAHLDQDPTNNSAINLKALCQECHLEYDRQPNQEKLRQTWQTRGKEILRKMSETRFLRRLRRQPTLFPCDEKPPPPV